jgi:hypothetical protein
MEHTIHNCCCSRHPKEPPTRGPYNCTTCRADASPCLATASDAAAAARVSSPAAAATSGIDAAEAASASVHKCHTSRLSPTPTRQCTAGAAAHCCHGRHTSEVSVPFEHARSTASRPANIIRPAKASRARLGWCSAARGKGVALRCA